MTPEFMSALTYILALAAVLVLAAAVPYGEEPPTSKEDRR